MSTSIDSKVVEMRFDNRHFESNVKTSMSTLEKLKQSLNLSGASKSLENVNAAAGKVNLNPISTAVDTVQAKFSALQVMGVTALANITNSAVNAGKRMVKALTLDPVMTGFQEYETQINAVQTILANTQSKGSTIDDVNKALDTLNTYADKTIYNFTEMTRNIGTFTAAGVDLQTSVDSIQGIANLAAVSGSTSQQASTAMYQLSQALAAGKVSLMDWNSVVNAGMGGELFQNALIRTSELLKTGAKDAIATYGSFRESLTKGEWLTTEVLTETLKQISGAYSEADLIAQGFTKEQAKEITSLATTATDAATKVKTFTQLWDVMKESAQSGWTQTWEILVGDFEQAKALLTPLADFFTGIIGKMSDARNNLLKSALGKGVSDTFKGLLKPLNAAQESIDKLSKPLENVTSAFKSLDEAADAVISGKFGNGKKRFDALTEAGENYYRIQNKVNEKMGDSHRYSEELIASQDELIKKQATSNEQKTESAKKTQEQSDSTFELTETTKKQLKVLMSLSEEELRAKGYTDDQIQAFKDLGEQANKLGMPMNEFIDNLDQINGRWLLINSFKNIGKSLVSVFTDIGNAWKGVFDSSTEEKAASIFNIIGGFHKLTMAMTKVKDHSDEITRTFKGLFALIDIIATITGGALKIAFKIVAEILSRFDLNILDVTAGIGDAIVKFRDWIDSILNVSAAVDFLMPFIQKAGAFISKWAETIKNSDAFTKFGERIRSVGKAFREWFSGLKGSDNIAGDFIKGFLIGLKNGIAAIGKAIFEVGKTIITKFAESIGVQSPSWIAEEDGEYFGQGFINGIASIATKVWEAVKGLGEGIVSTFKKIDFGKVLAGGLGASMLIIITKIIKVVDKFVSPLENLGDMFGDIGEGVKALTKGAGKALKGLGSYFKAEAFKKNAQAVLILAIAIGILAAAVYALSSLDPGKLWGAIGAIAALAAVVVALAFAATQLSKLDVGGSMSKIGVSMLLMATSLLVFVNVMEKLAQMDINDFPTVMAYLAGMIVTMYTLIASLALFGNNPAFKAAGSMMRNLAVSMMLMVVVIKLIAKIPPEDIKKGLAVMAALELMFVAIVAITKFAGPNAAKAGTMLLMMASAMGIMIFLIKIISFLDDSEINRGIGVMFKFGLLFAVLVSVSQFAGKNAVKAGAMLLMMAGAMAIMAVVLHIIAGLNKYDLEKALGAVMTLGVMFAALIAVTALAGENAVKAGIMLLMMSTALLMLTGVIFIISQFETSDLVRGVTVVAILEGLFAGLIAVTKLAQDVKSMLIVMIVAIGILTTAVIALSYIEPDRLFGATAALSVLMAVFAGLVAATKFAKASASAIIMIAVLLGVVVALSFIVKSMAEMNAEAALGHCAALSLLLLSMSAAVAILSLIGGNAVNALLGVVALLAMAVPLIAFVGVLAVMQNVQKAADNAVILTAFATAMTVLLIPLSVIGLLVAATGGLILLGIAALLLMAVPLIAFVGVLAVMQNIENATSNVMLLTYLMGSMTDMLIKVSLVAPLAVIGVMAMTALMGLIIAIGALAIGLGALMEKFPQIEEFLDKGIPILEKLGYAIGSVIGNMITGFVNSLDLSGLVTLGLQLSLFMMALQPFINGVKMVDDSVLTGVGVLAAAVLALTAADLISGIASFIQGGSSFAQLGAELSAFMFSAMPFIVGMKALDPSVAEGVKALAETILVLTAADILDGLTSWFTGGSSIADFGAELAAFGPYMRQYANAVKGIDADTVKKSAEAAQILIGVAKDLPNSGGIAGFFAGENDMDTFGSQMAAFGHSLKRYSEAVKGVDAEAVKLSAEATEAMADVADSIPNTGGIAGFFAGDNNIDTFGTMLTTYGMSLKIYSDSVQGIDAEAIAVSAEATKSLSEVAANLPNSGGVAGFFAGDNDMGEFGTQLTLYGGALVNYASAVKYLNAYAIENSVKASAALSDLANNLPDTKWFSGDNDLGKFGDKIVDFGYDLVTFSSSVEGVSATKISGIATQLSRLSEATEDVDLAEGKLKSFADSLGNIGKSGVDKFVNAFNTGVFKATAASKKIAEGTLKAVDHLKDDFGKVGIAVIKQFTEGFVRGKKLMIEAINGTVASAVSSIRGKYDTFYSAGSYLVAGFANGISANTYKAKAKAKAMAEAAEEAAKEALDINSPSKVFRAIGTSVPEGFAMGIDKLGYMVMNSSTSMAKSAVGAVSNSISKISGIINSDIDAQPTIRPVLDLSDVRTGASAISGMFNSGATVGVMANVGAINSMMNQNRQNGADSDVVSAINKLRADISGMERASYTINGVTYDDGSNVASAVKSLVRAAKIERRT